MSLIKLAKNNYIGNQCYCKVCHTKIVEGDICKKCMKEEKEKK